MNITEHWAVRRKRFNEQASRIRDSIQKYIEYRQVLPCVVTLTRVAPRKFDYDNLVAGMKHVRDTVSSILRPGFAPGRADDTDDIRWEYAQEVGEPKVKALKIKIQGI